ncbi:MFS transporter [Aquabacterium soli]|jgi:MFS family permease|uniref:MFS transporter n=1 Tax=Aquabacterium soli TaxID=2493092 RepID=A0A426VA97_9BURK|nr:MFS transporter [Aquabacterium soli]RRS03784.1 MFS transporter [Aquabacterium soli]
MSKPLSSPWWVVVGSLLGLTVGNGPVMQFTFGVFVKPLSEALNTDRGAISGALLAGLVATGIATPFIGRLIDRHGIRRISLPAIVLFALGMAAMGLLVQSPAALIVMYALCGIVASGQTPLPYSKAIAAVIDDRRGLALGIATAGVGLGTMLMPMFAQHLIGSVGWRGAYVGLGLLTLVVALPAMAGLVTRGEAARQATASGQASAKPLDAPGMTAAQARTSGCFWALALAFFCVALAASGVMAHIVPLMSDRGVPAASATKALGAAGVALVVGRLIAGWLLDRVHAPRVALAFFSLPLIGIGLLLGTTDASFGIPAAVLVGLGLGAEVDLIAYLQSRYLGMKAFGEIYGYLFAIFMLGSGLGPFVMGQSFAKLHSYQPALMLLSAALVVACLLMARLGPYTYQPASRPAPARGGAAPEADKQPSMAT